MRLLVDQLLDQLPDREAEIMRLRFYDELTQSEIAERMGISQMHVSRLMRRCLGDLRAALDA
jgi:RNA polymerase sigma-B factor